MLSDTYNIDVKPVQAEPAQWHVYRALALYARENPKDTKGLYYCHKLHEAHTAYLNSFEAK